jgi:hypothetical protein
MSHTARSIAIGLVLGFGLALGGTFVRHASEITIAWGNAWTEHERRAAAEDARRAETEKLEIPLRAANEDYNEAHCKVTVPLGLGGAQVITNVRRIHPTSENGVYLIGFSGGVDRTFEVLKTEDCK